MEELDLSGCSNLERIGSGAFSAGNTAGKLETIDLSKCSALELIGKEAFLNQADLESITFPNTFTWIAAAAGLLLPIVILIVIGYLLLTGPSIHDLPDQ